MDRDCSHLWREVWDERTERALQNMHAASEKKLVFTFTQKVRTYENPSLMPLV